MQKSIWWLVIAIMFLKGCGLVQLKPDHAEAVNYAIGFEAGILIEKRFPAVAKELYGQLKSVGGEASVLEIISTRLSTLNQKRLANFLAIVEVRGLELTLEQKAAINGFTEGLKGEEQ